MISDPIVVGKQVLPQRYISTVHSQCMRSTNDNDSERFTSNFRAFQQVFGYCLVLLLQWQYGLSSFQEKDTKLDRVLAILRSNIELVYYCILSIEVVQSCQKRTLFDNSRTLRPRTIFLVAKWWFPESTYAGTIGQNFSLTSITFFSFLKVS